MKTRRVSSFALIGLLFTVLMAALQHGAASARTCYNAQQQVIPCPETKTPRPIPPTSTPTSSPTPTDTPTPQQSVNQPPGDNNPGQVPPEDGLQWPVIDGRLLPPWVFVVGGLWLVILIGLLLLWRFGGKDQSPNDPSSPQDGKHRTRRPSKRAWGTATLLWLVVGATVVVFHQEFSVLTGPICGVDVFPDWTVKSIEVKKNDDIVVTVANIGPCPTRSIVGHWNWGKTKVGNPYVDPYVTVEGAAPGVAPTPGPTGDPDKDAWRGFGMILFLNRLPALASGETTTFTVHIELSYFYLTHGDSKFGYIVNYPREYKEEDYYNNSLVVP
jgi:hypothetical protein